MKEHETPIRVILGDAPMVRVLDVLIENPRHDCSKRELAEAAGVSPPTLNKIWGDLHLFRIDAEAGIGIDVCGTERSLSFEGCTAAQPIKGFKTPLWDRFYGGLAVCRRRTTNG